MHPQTIPAHGQATVKVTFEPSTRALEDLGESLASYALGYLSLDQQVMCELLGDFFRYTPTCHLRN